MHTENANTLGWASWGGVGTGLRDKADPRPPIPIMEPVRRMVRRTFLKPAAHTLRGVSRKRKAFFQEDLSWTEGYDPSMVTNGRAAARDGWFRSVRARRPVFTLLVSLAAEKTTLSSPRRRFSVRVSPCHGRRAGNLGHGLGRAEPPSAHERSGGSWCRSPAMDSAGIVRSAIRMNGRTRPCVRVSYCAARVLIPSRPGKPGTEATGSRIRRRSCQQSNKRRSW
jgi:hypothetical protein